MKNIIAGLVFLSILLSTGCSAISDEGTPQPTEETPEEEAPPTQTTGQDGNLIKSELARETNPQVPLEDLLILAQDLSKFATAFYHQIRGIDGNIIFSPISISQALSMTMAGAETSTEEAMMQTLQYSLSENQVHPAFNALLLAVEASEKMKPEESEGSEFQLNIANSIWGQAGYAFESAFLDILARHYGAGLYNVDYIGAPEAARGAINDWIEEETEEKIKDLIPPGAINELTRMVLANAIYFNGSWRYPFNEEITQPAAFTLLDGSESSVDMMALSGESLPYTAGDGYQVVQLPYLSPDFVMTLFVPDQGNFNEFEDGLDAERLLTAAIDLQDRPVNLRMPKFDFETSTNAKEPLTALGMGEAFLSDKADFSGMAASDQLFISDVLHKATITVDEKGTEAAAATVVIMRVKSAPVGDQPITLVIDRPFLFLIQHQPTGSILFMGRVVDP